MFFHRFKSKRHYQPIRIEKYRGGKLISSKIRYYHPNPDAPMSKRLVKNWIKKIESREKNA